jgi:hypothetical protein
MGVKERIGSTFELHFAHIGVPVISFDCALGDKVMQIRFMQYHNARVRQSLIVNKAMECIVPELIDGGVKGGRIEARRYRRKDLHVSQFGERFNQRRRIIRDAAL